MTRDDGLAGPGPTQFLALAVPVALAAAVATVSLFLGSKVIVLTLGGLIGLIVCFVLSGNQRLFCLWGLALTGPIGMFKAFSVDAHMGGASAVTIDVSDLFLAPLLLFILRDAVRRRRPLRFSPVLAWWGAMILLGAADVALGPLRHLALLEVIRMTKCGLLFFVLTNELVRVRQFMHFFAAVAIGIAMQSAFALVQYTFKANLGLQFLGEPAVEATTSATQSVYLGTADIFRAGGLFSHPNLLAGYLALLLPICIAMIFSRVTPAVKAALGGVIALGLGALVITLSRSGWLSFATGFALLFATSLLHQKLRLRYMLARVLVIISILAAGGLASGDIIRRITSSDPGALKFRFEMIDTAWTMILDKPVLGMGLNSFVARFPAYAPRGGPEQVTAEYGTNWPVVHNSYLITWTEQGTVGFICLLGVYFTLLRAGLRTSRVMLDDIPYALSMGASCGIVAIMVDGIGSFFIDESAGMRVFWMVAALVVAVHDWTRVNQPAYAAAALARTPGRLAVGAGGASPAGLAT